MTAPDDAGRRRLDVTIERLAYGGDGVARPAADAPVVFVPRSAPGDRLRVEVVEERPRFRRARIDSIDAPGPGRVAPACRHYQGRDDAGSCGGCHYQHLAYAAQLETKAAQVEEAICRIGRLSPRFLPPVGAEAALGYRNKGTLHWSAERGAFGLVAADGSTTLPIECCPLLVPPADRTYRAIAGPLERLARADGAVRGALLSLVVRAGEATGETLAAVVVRPGAPPSIREALRCLADPPSTVVLDENPSPARALFGGRFEAIVGGGTIRERIGEVLFELDAETFLQVNTRQAVTLYAVAAKLARLAPTDRVLDLYCGNGGIALSVARACREVVGVETVASAVEMGKRSAALNGIENVRFRVGRVESSLKRLHHGERFRPDVAFVDPPRAGLHRTVVDSLARLRPRRIVYVSCNPTTLARDLRAFAAHGFATREVVAVDLFPQTYHVEAVALLEREKGSHAA